MEKACRVCLIDTGNSGQSLWTPTVGAEGSSLGMLLRKCAKVPVTTQDGLPQHLCAICARSLVEAFSFLVKCRRTHQKLIAKNVVTIKPEPEDQSPFDHPVFEVPLYTDEDAVDLDEPHKDSSISIDDPLIPDDPKKNKLACLSCNFISKDTKMLKAHVKREHTDDLGNVDYQCNICGRHFKRKTELVVHKRIHTGEKPFACEFCPMKFAQSGTLIEHRRNHTGEIPYACETCSRPFASRSSLWRHRLIHSKEKRYSCEICGKSFTHRSTLKHHRLVHTDEKPYVCKVCSKCTKSKYSLQQHMFVHLEKSYVCDQCAKRFAVKANLVNHMKKMHSEEAGKCQYCNKNTSNLAEHMLIHAKKNAYECTHCEKSFKQRKTLKYHMNLHDNAEKYKCLVEGCAMAFPKPNMLTFHKLKVHSNETPHICQYCSKGYLRSSDLNRHLNSFHSDAVQTLPLEIVMP